MSGEGTASAAPPSLVEFLAARLDEDQAAAWAVHDVTKCDALLYEENMPAAAARDPACDCGYPARVLREVAAGRAILAMYDEETGMGMGADGTPCLVLLDVMRHLAAVYSDHPGYQAEWKGGLR